MRKLKTISVEMEKEIRAVVRDEVRRMKIRAANREERIHADTINSLGDTYGGGD